MDKPTVTSEELKRMAEQSYKRLGGVAQPDARVIRGLLARIQELETAGRKLVNNLSEDTIEEAREVWLNTNTRIIKDARNNFAALLNNLPLEKE